MTFNEYWKKVEETGILSRVAIQMLPTSFSDELKEQMMKADPEDVAKACQKAINEINRGSVDTIEALIRKQL